MSAVGRNLRGLLRYAVGVALVAGTLVHSRAEVSVTVDPATGAPANGSIVLASIVDGPDPILGVWARYGQISASRVLLNESGATRGDGPPTVLGNPAGQCAVAWARNSATGFDVVLSVFENGAWTAETVLAGTSADELDPVLLSAPDGTVHLFYWEPEPTGRILHRTAPADLSSWSTPEQVSELGVVSARPAAAFHDGALWLSYEVHPSGLDQSPREVVVAKLDNGQWLRQIVAVSYAGEPLRPEIHGRAGRLWVDWIDAPGQSLWLRQESGGSWGAIQSVPYGSPLEEQYFVRGTVRSIAIQ